jgi:hypothetical protein
VTAAPTVAGADGRIRPMGVSDSVTDPKGDVKNEDGMGVTQPEADIVSAGAEDRGADIVLRLLVDHPTDPATTKNWEGDTVAAWAIDNTGDDQPEYAVAFVRDANGALGVQVSGADGTSSACGTASIGPDGSYVATVPAGCLGDPGSFRYAAAMAWDTDPANDSAPAVGDTAPDGDTFSGPVTKP